MQDIEGPGNARADFPNASEERNLRNISRHSRVLFERIHGTEGIWRVASGYRLFNTPAFRPCSPCYPTQAVVEPIVSHIRNPYLTFPGRVHHFHRRLDPGLGRSHGGFSDCGCMDPFQTRAPHQCTGAQGGNIGPQSLGYSITGSSCFDCYRQYHCCSSHQQTRWDPFPPSVAGGSGSVSVVSDSGHNSKSQTHSGLPKCDSRPLVSAEPAHHDRVESPPGSRESDIQTVGNSSSGQVYTDRQTDRKTDTRTHTHRRT